MHWPLHHIPHAQAQPRRAQSHQQISGQLVADTGVIGFGVHRFAPVSTCKPKEFTFMHANDTQLILNELHAIRQRLTPVEVMNVASKGLMTREELKRSQQEPQEAAQVREGALAQIVIDVLPGGRVRLSSTCLGRPDSRYAPLDERQAPWEVQRLLGELRDRLAQR